MRAVLDTNVVLDCFVFGNTGCRPLVQALEARQLEWVASPGMRSELEHVLQRGLGARWVFDAAAVLTLWDRHARPLEQTAVCRLLCSDPDDQKFIDLALAHSIPWLLTRDRALLRLARRARLHGVRVSTPERWTKEWAAEAAHA